MEDRFTVEYEMTEDLARRVARAVLADRKLLRSFRQMVGLPLLLLTVLLFWPTLLAIRDSLSPVALVAVFLIVALGYWLLLSILVYRYACWSILIPFYGQSKRLMRLIFSDEHIFMETGEHSGEQNWKDFDQIQVFSSVWLFRLQSGGHVALPVAVLSPELEALIRRKATEYGISIHE
jgi:hypothetical protein